MYYESGFYNALYNSSTSTDGTSGEVKALAHNNGLIYIGGSFSSAGGLANFQNFAIYGNSSGWTYSSYYPPLKAGTSGQSVTGLSVLGNGKIRVSGPSLSSFVAICGSLTATGGNADHDPIYPFCWTD